MRLPLLLLLGLFLGACNKPSPDDCRKAVLNLQKVRGQDAEHAPDVERAVRKCQATGSKKTVECLIQAKTAADADACEGQKSGNP